MATSYPLHPVAAQRLAELKDEFEKLFGGTPSDRKIVNAAVYGMTATQLLGTLEKFGRDRREYNDQHAGDPTGQAERKIAEK
jgi:hypothetical protein